MFKNKLKRNKKNRMFSVLFLLCMILLLNGCDKEPEATTEEYVIEDFTSMAEGVMSYEQVQNLQDGFPVVVDVTVKEKTGWEDYKADIIAQESDGTYIVEGLKCSKETYDILSVGDNIRVTGYRGTEDDSIVITDASLEILE